MILDILFYLLMCIMWFIAGYKKADVDRGNYCVKLMRDIVAYMESPDYQQLTPAEKNLYNLKADVKIKVLKEMFDMKPPKLKWLEGIDVRNVFNKKGG